MPFSLHFLSALPRLLPNSHLDVFLCFDPAFLLLFSKLSHTFLKSPLTFFFCSPIILSLRAISLPYIEEYLSLLFFLYALLFSPPLCRRSTLFFFLQLKSLSGVTHNSTISTVELVLKSLALFVCRLTYFISFQYFLQFSCPDFRILPNLTSLIIFPYRICSLSPSFFLTPLSLSALPLQFCKHKHLGVCNQRYPG